MIAPGEFTQNRIHLLGVLRVARAETQGRRRARVRAQDRAQDRAQRAWIPSSRPVACGLLAVVLLAIHLPPRSVSAQVVQLPTWRVFAVDTSVLVPDQGSVVLGGVNSARETMVSRRPPLLPFPPFASASRQHAVGSGRVTVSATIIDHREWDEALLAQARALRGPAAQPGPVAQEADWISQHVQHTASDVAGRSSVEQLKQQAQQLAVMRQDRQQCEAASLLRHGDLCLERGQYATARMFYRTAWRQGQGAVRQQVEVKLSQLRLAQDRAEGAARH